MTADLLADRAICPFAAQRYGSGRVLSSIITPNGVAFVSHDAPPGLVRAMVAAAYEEWTR